MKKLIAAIVCCIFLCPYIHGELKQTYKESFITVVKYSSPGERELNCLTYAILREAGNESTLGKAAVGRVIINRVNLGVAPTVCAVLGQHYKNKCQFSFACKPGRQHVDNLQWVHCKEVAEEILDDNAFNNILPSNTLFFNNTPFKSKGFKQVAKIGHQWFYKLRKA